MQDFTLAKKKGGGHNFYTRNLRSPAYSGQPPLVPENEILEDVNCFQVHDQYFFPELEIGMVTG